MPKENQRVAISKRLLKNGVLKLLQEKHINDISVVELCELAEINRTTFYRHYQTPHDVLIDMELDLIRNYNEGSISLNDVGDIKKETIRACEFVYEHREMVKLFIENNTDNDFSHMFQRFSDPFLRYREVMYKGQVITPDAFKLMQTFFSHGSYALVKQWIMEDIPMTPQEVADLVYGSLNQDLTFK